MEAYLKKLCFEYQVEEREVTELLARMEMVHLDKGETIASATMPEQKLVYYRFRYLAYIFQSSGKGQDYSLPVGRGCDIVLQHKKTFRKNTDEMCGLLHQRG